MKENKDLINLGKKITENPSLKVYNPLLTKIKNVRKHGIEVFGTEEKFNKWLDTENFYFDKKKPSTFMSDSTKLDFLEMKLTNIEYGDLA